jgi:hypothetical protein
VGVFVQFDLRLYGTAVCTRAVTVQAFVTLEAQQHFARAQTAARLANVSAAAPAAGQLVPTSHSLCYISDVQLLSAVAVTMVLVWIYYYFNVNFKEVLELGEQQLLTAADFSVLVEDPDPDARDPDEWRDYFSKYGAVAAVGYTATH